MENIYKYKYIYLNNSLKKIVEKEKAAHDEKFLLLIHLFNASAVNSSTCVCKLERLNNMCHVKSI